MRCARVIFTAAIMLGLAGAAQANSINDPGAFIKGGGGSFVIHGLTFKIFAPNGTGTFFFDNGNNFTLKNLTFTFTPGGPGGTARFRCGSLPGNSGVPAFTTCVYSHIGGPNSFTTLKFFGGSGIKAHGEFAVELTGWPTNLSSQVLANTPEPATMSLVLLGAGAAWLRRRRMAG